MVATQTRLRRGTKEQIDSKVPAADEPISDTSNKRLRIGDGVTPGGIHHANARDVQSQIMSAAVAGGSANALELELNPPLSEYEEFTKVTVRITAPNTTSATLDVDGLGAVAIKKWSGTSLVDLTGGELRTNTYQDFIYNGTVWVLQQSIAGGGSGFNIIKYTASGTYSKPSNLVSVTVELQAPGANGNISSSFTGSGGGYSKTCYQADELSASESFVIGSTSTFKGMTCKNDGSATGGDLDIPGQAIATGANLPGGNSVLGHGGVVGSPAGKGYGGGGASTNTGGTPTGAGGIIIFTEIRS